MSPHPGSCDPAQTPHGALSPQAFLWDSFQRVQQQLLKRQPLADPPVVPPGHRPLSRAQSSPATATTVSLPAQDTKALSLPVQEQPPKPHFTTGKATPEGLSQPGWGQEGTWGCPRGSSWSFLEFWECQERAGGGGGTFLLIWGGFPGRDCPPGPDCIPGTALGMQGGGIKCLGVWEGSHRFGAGSRRFGAPRLGGDFGQYLGSLRAEGAALSCGRARQGWCTTR